MKLTPGGSSACQRRASTKDKNEILSIKNFFFDAPTSSDASSFWQLSI